MFLSDIIKFSFTTASRATPPKRRLADVVSEQLEAINAAAPAEWQGRREMPDPTAEDLERYDVAMEYARRHCPHKRSMSTTYARHEYQCLDCGRYFERQPSGLFGFFS